MKIIKINIKFKNKEISLPKEGEFSQGINVIYSSGNNKGKTTLLRSIMNVFFSNSISFPIQKKEIGNIEKIIVQFKNSKGVFKAILSKENEEKIFVVDNNQKTMWFNNKNELLSFVIERKIPSEKEIRASIFGPSIYLDQDYPWNSKSLWPTLWKHQKSLMKARYWLYESPTNMKWTEYNDVVEELKKQIKIIDDKISVLKELIGDNITLNHEYDVEILNNKYEESKLNQNKYKNNLSKINFEKAKLYKLELLSSKNNKINKNNFFYILGETLEGKTIQVKVDLDSLINFTNDPIKEVSAEMNNEIKITKSKIKDLEKSSIQLENELKKIPDDFKIPSFNYDELIQKRKILCKKLESEKKVRDNYNQDNKYLKKQIKIMNDKLARLYKEFESKFTDFNSKSGSDIFVSKISEYLSFISTIKNFNFPLIVDSGKEKDFSIKNQKTLIDLLRGISTSRNMQSFISFSDPDREMIKGLKSFEL